MGTRFETLVRDLLPALGLTAKATRFKIYRDNAEVGEVDILAVDDKGETYAIEVKAGKVDISGIRQAYINAYLLKAKPMVVARGYADDGAKALARELDVEVVILPDYLFLSLDDLATAVVGSMARLLHALLATTAAITPEIERLLSECGDLYCLCNKTDCAFLNQLPREARSYELLKAAAFLKSALIGCHGYRGDKEGVQTKT